MTPEIRITYKVSGIDLALSLGHLSIANTLVTEAISLANKIADADAKKRVKRNLFVCLNNIRCAQRIK